MFKIYLLCDVVDNYGDIGFVYRLARDLYKLDSSLNLVIVVNNLDAFSKITGKNSNGTNIINENLSEQNCTNIKILNWNDSKTCSADYDLFEPQIILQCFQCKRPLWLEEKLFCPQKKTLTYIINIEYLTAEDWAEDFHLLKSATRSSFVKKYNFMPGFTKKTGGLVLDQPFLSYAQKHFFLKDDKAISTYLKPFLSDEQINLLFNPQVENILVFSYQKNFSSMLKAFNLYKQKTGKQLHILAAQGAGYQSLVNALDSYKDNFIISHLPFIPYYAWDALLFLTDISFIRGEDSLSRACLAGIPFIWHAYKQKDDWQLVKVNALLNLMKQYFPLDKFSLISDLWNNYNASQNDLALEEKQIFDFMQNAKNLKPYFEKFSLSLLSLGDAGQKLLEFLKQLNF